MRRFVVTGVAVAVVCLCGATAGPRAGMAPRQIEGGTPCGLGDVAVDEHGFGHIALGDAVSDWFPVDVDSDGVWELAVRSTVGSLHSVGVFDPKSGQWIDGPRGISGGMLEWGVDDYDADGLLEYAYRRADTIRILDPTNGADSALWVIPFALIGNVVFWGETTAGKSCVGINEHSDSSRSHSTPDGPVYERWFSSNLRVYEVVGGQEVKTIPGGPSPWRFVYGVPGSNSTSLGVHVESYSEYQGPPSMSARFEGVSLYSQNWTLLDSVVIKPGWSGSWEPPFSCALEGFALGVPPGSSSCYALIDLSMYYPNLRVRPLNATIGSWQFIGTWYQTYACVVAFDLQKTGTSQWILPLPGDGWERRELATGALIDTMAGMPSADLRTGALFTAGNADLFYIADSTLYVWMPDAYTTVGGDQSGPVPDAELALHAVPNPFNSAVRLSWVGAAESARLEILNILGQRVWEFDLSASGVVSSVVWDGVDASGRSVPSGVYFARLQTRARVAVTKVVLLK